MRNKTLIVALMTTLSACATPGYQRIPAEIVNPSAQGPKDIGTDALEVSKFHVFDNSTFGHVQAAIKSNQNDRDKAHAIRGVLCDGRRPKVNSPELFVTLVMPKGDQQDSVETISRQTKEFIKLARLYLKRWLIMDASAPDLIGQNVNPDFANFKENVIDTGYERRQANNRVTVFIPFLSAKSSTETIKYYSDLRATPALPQLQLEPQFWYPSRYFMAVMDQRERKIVLSIKAADFVKTAYGHLNYGTESTIEVVRALQLKPYTIIQYVTGDDSRIIRNHALYSFSPNAWKMDNGAAVRPLRMTVIEDIGVLRQLFAWRLPKDVVEKTFKTTLASDQRRFSLDHDKFSPDLAISHAQDAWNAIMLSQTEVSEAANDDGTIRFQVSAKFLDLFCQHSVAVPDLKGR